jgi:hypothetical protein
MKYGPFHNADFVKMCQSSSTVYTCIKIDNVMRGRHAQYGPDGRKYLHTERKFMRWGIHGGHERARL